MKRGTVVLLVMFTVAGCETDASDADADRVDVGEPGEISVDASAEVRAGPSAPTHGSPITPAPAPTPPRYVEPRRSVLSNEQVGRLAIPFQENDGQWDDEVAFKADHFAGSLWVTRDGKLVYSLLGVPIEDPTEPIALTGVVDSLLDDEQQDPLRSTRLALGVPTSAVHVAGSLAAPPQQQDPMAEHRHELTQRGPGWTLVESFVNGRPRRPRGLEQAITNVSYFIGNDESKWASHVSTFGALTLGEVWPGIEVRLVARGNNVEKFFHVRPHRDPSLIEMRIEGSEPLRLSDDGALIVTTGHGEVELSPPVAYQVIDGERREVDVDYLPVMMRIDLLWATTTVDTRL